MSLLRDFMLYHAVSLLSEPEWLCKWVCPINFSSLGDTGATHEKLFKWIRFSPFSPSLSGILFVAEKIEQIGPFERCHPPGMVYFSSGSVLNGLELWLFRRFLLQSRTQE